MKRTIVVWLAKRKHGDYMLFTDEPVEAFPSFPLDSHVVWKSGSKSGTHLVSNTTIRNCGVFSQEDLDWAQPGELMRVEMRCVFSPRYDREPVVTAGKRGHVIAATMCNEWRRLLKIPTRHKMHITSVKATDLYEWVKDDA